MQLQLGARKAKSAASVGLPRLPEVAGIRAHDTTSRFRMQMFVGMAVLFYVLRSRSAPQNSLWATAALEACRTANGMVIAELALRLGKC